MIVDTLINGFIILVIVTFVVVGIASVTTHRVMSALKNDGLRGCLDVAKRNWFFGRSHIEVCTNFAVNSGEWIYFEEVTND